MSNLLHPLVPLFVSEAIITLHAPVNDKACVLTTINLSLPIHEMRDL